MNQEKKRFKPAPSRVELSLAALMSVIPFPFFLGFNSNQGPQWQRLWAPLQFNMALGIALLGAGLVALQLKHWKVTRVVAALVFCLAVLTLSEHAVYNGHPGRMAFNNALSLLFVSVSLMFLMSSQEKFKFSWLFAGLLSGFTAALNFTVLTFSVLKISSSSNVGSITHTSVPAAIAMFLISLLILLRSWKAMRLSEATKYQTYPLVVVSVISFLTIVIWQIAILRESSQLNSQLNVLEEKFASETLEKIRQIENVMTRFASRLGTIGLKNSTYLEADSINYINQIDSIKHIGITDDKMNVIWSNPKPLRGQVVHFSKATDEARKEAGDAARVVKKAVLSRAVYLKSGGTGHLLPAPFFRKGKFLGAAYATLQSDRIFDDLVDQRNFDIRIRETSSGLTVFENHPNDAIETEYQLQTTVNRGFAKWEFRAIPTQNYVSHHVSHTPQYTLFIGELFALIAGLLSVIFARNHSKVEAAVRREQELLRRMNFSIEAGKIGAWSFDLSSGEMWRSEGHDKVFGHDKPLSEWSQSLFFAHVHEEDRQSVAANQKLNLTKSGPQSSEARIRSARDHSIRWITIVSETIYDNCKKPLQFVGIVKDITEDKLREAEKEKAEEELRRAHERLQRVIEVTGEGTWERDYVSRKIIYIDQRGKEVFGFSPDQNPTYEDLTSRLFPEDRPMISKALEDHLQNQTPRFYIEFRVRDANSPDGVRWARTIGQITGNAKHPGRLVATLNDVTEVVKSRMALEAALKTADAATVAKSAFLSNMSHEIRTPLNGIIGMTDLLLEAELGVEERAHAQVVQQSGNALLSLINNILDFSKIEAGKMELEESSFEMVTIIEEQLDILAVQAKKKSISLVSFVSPDFRTPLLGDAGRLGQVLLNFIGNAIKFTSFGGVSVRAFKKKILTQEFVRVEVRDTGIGLPPAGIEKLFTPFTQADSSVSNKYGGTGLGLSICKKLIEAMHGSIGVQSKVGEGSMFWFEFPLRKSEQKPASLATDDWVALYGARALVIESDAVSRSSTLQFIASLKMRPLGVISAKEAGGALDVASFEKNPFLLMVIGAKVGSQTGLDLILEIQKYHPNAPSAIYLSEFADPRKESEIIEAGFSKVLRRPIKQSDFLNSIASLLAPETLTQLKPESVQTSESSSPVTPTGFRILVAEDNSANQLLMKKMLETMGHSCFRVANGQEVLDALGRATFDLILMDCHMPEMDGYEAATKIRNMSDPRLRVLPIIAITANASAVEGKKCLDFGMNDHLSKPMRKEQLKAILDKWLGAQIGAAPFMIPDAKILLVDDHEENRLLIIKYLKNTSSTIEIAVDGQDAIDKFKQSKFDLVLMDMRMPIKDGYTATKEIRDWEQTSVLRRTPIVALTANALKEEIAKTFEVGCDSYLSKPLRKQTLLDALGKIFAQDNNQKVA